MFEEDDLKIKRARAEEIAPKSYSIARIAKMKSFAQVRGMSKHNNREFVTPNADEEKTPDNVQLVGTNDIEADVKKRITESGMDLKKIRKNAVLAVDHMLTASPKYFRPNGEKPGEYDQQRLDDWVEASMKFLIDQYGDNLVNSKLHLDESTPHIHAVVVPVHHDPNKRQPINLRAKEWFNGAKALSSFQDLYYQYTQHLGLERGIKNSKARHQRVKTYYSHLNQASQKVTGIKPDDLLPKKKGVMQKETPQEVADRINSLIKQNNLHLSDKAITAEEEQRKRESLERVASKANESKELFSGLLKGLSPKQKQEAVKAFALKTHELRQLQQKKKSKFKSQERD